MPMHPTVSPTPLFLSHVLLSLPSLLCVVDCIDKMIAWKALADQANGRGCH